MPPKRPVRPSLLRRIGCGTVMVALLALFGVLFIPELLRVLGVGWELLKSVLGLPTTGMSWETFRAFQVLFFNCCFGFMLVLALFLFVTGVVILPARTLTERFLAGIYLLLAILGMHGPRIYIRDGKFAANPADMKRDRPGVVVIDPHSAAVLEARIHSGGVVMILMRMLMRLMELFHLIDPPESPRIIGPGLTFMRPEERLRGVVDLRKQIRFQPGIAGYTRDGIEVSANLWVVFSIGQELAPDALQVTYQGEMRAENLRVVQLERLPDGRIKVARILDGELDTIDRDEIHQYARVAGRIGELRPFEMLPPLDPVPDFIPERVFAAVLYQPRQDETSLRPWSELPTQVAQDIFREALLQVNYDHLYRVDDPAYTPLEDLRRTYRRELRNAGALAYRLIFQRFGDPLEVGIYPAEDLLVSPVNELRNPKILRERGIKVIACGFGDLIPQEAVYRQRLESWRAVWQRDTELTLASHELEALRLRNRARAQAQQELTVALAQIFKEGEVSEEVMALRVFQALEAAAVDPKTRQLLPVDTINLMRGIREWLLPGEIGRDLFGGAPTPPEEKKAP